MRRWTKEEADRKPRGGWVGGGSQTDKSVSQAFISASMTRPTSWPVADARRRCWVSLVRPCQRLKGVTGVDVSIAACQLGVTTERLAGAEERQSRPRRTICVCVQAHMCINNYPQAEMSGAVVPFGKHKKIYIGRLAALLKKEKKRPSTADRRNIYCFSL